MAKYEIDLTLIERDLKIKLPIQIVEKIQIWANRVEKDGLIKTRQIKSYHDEPLKGKRLGQRSVRLNRKYRLFYKEFGVEIIVVQVLEVNAHEY